MTVAQKYNECLEQKNDCDMMWCVPFYNLMTFMKREHEKIIVFFFVRLEIGIGNLSTGKQ